MSAFYFASQESTAATTDPPTIQVSAADGDIDAVRSALNLNLEACNAQDDNGYSPLAAAVSYGHAAITRLLLDAGASTDLADNDGDTPLHVCSTVTCASILLREGGQELLMLQNADGKTPLECNQEQLEEARMQLYAEQMLVMNANAATAESDARMCEPSPETVAEVNRLQLLVAFLEAGGDTMMMTEHEKDSGVQKDQEEESVAVEVAEAVSEVADSEKEPPP